MHDDWPGRVLNGIAEIAGTQAREEVAARWDEHAARTKPEITVLGPYDVGKSSLIRRLLAEDGLPAPEWLTVSARRETFELNEVDGAVLTYTDTPGFGSTAARHDALAEDAVTLSDAFLLVVAPQLLTEQREWITTVLSGEHFFGQPAGTVAHATIAAIAQADTLGVDPEDDVEGMRALAERKRAELIAQLGMAGAGLEVVVVAADPYGEQAHAPQLDAADFDPYRNWDGIDALRAALTAFVDRAPELRAAAEQRYLSRMGRRIQVEADGVIAETEAAAADLESRAKQFAGVRRRVEGVVAAARDALESDVTSAAVQLADEVSAHDPTAQEEVDARLDTVVARWEARWNAELDLVLGESGVEAESRMVRPSAQRTKTFLSALAAPPSGDGEPAPNSRVIKVLNDVRGQLESAAKGSFALRLGEDFEAALEAGRKAKHPKQPKPEDGSWGTHAVRVQAGLQVFNGVLGIATTLEAELRQGTLERELAEQRERARDALERAADELAAAIMDGDDGWRAAAGAGLRAVRERLGVPEDPAAVAALVQDAQTQRERLDRFSALLADCPAITGATG